MYQLPRVRVPPGLRTAPPGLLEEYVRARLAQFVGLLTQRLSQYVPPVNHQHIERATAEALAMLPPPDMTTEERVLQLVFRHDCLALGCLDPQCALCQHNPSRRCSVNFDRKYLVNDALRARCTAAIRVELIDPVTSAPVEDKLPDIPLQLCVLDGNLYDQKFLENARAQTEGEPIEELEQCALLLNKKKNTSLLVCGAGGSNDGNGYVNLVLSGGQVVLQDLHVTDSSEAILSGRKPPFRLLVRSMTAPGLRLKIRHAVSEGFVVATRRTRTAGKAEIPSVDDHVSKLEHMGKETVKKLQDLRTAAQQAGVEIEIPENCVQKVGEFKLLALRADQDGHLRQKLQHVLKLSKEKWEEARDHAMRAVVADSRMRAWYADRRSLDVGVLFTCRLGNVELDRPVGLLRNHIENGEAKVEAILLAQLTPAQRDMLRTLQPQAVSAWWTPGHPGWAIFPMDSDQFLQTGNLGGSAPSPLDSGPPSPSGAATSSMRGRATSHSQGSLGGPPPLAMSPEINDAMAGGFMGMMGPGGGHMGMAGGMGMMGPPGGGQQGPGIMGQGPGTGRMSRSGSLSDSQQAIAQAAAAAVQQQQQQGDMLPPGMMASHSGRAGSGALPTAFGGMPPPSMTRQGSFNQMQGQMQQQQQGQNGGGGGGGFMPPPSMTRQQHQQQQGLMPPPGGMQQQPPLFQERGGSYGDVGRSMQQQQQQQQQQRQQQLTGGTMGPPMHAPPMRSQTMQHTSALAGSTTINPVPYQRISSLPPAMGRQLQTDFSGGPDNPRPTKMPSMGHGPSASATAAAAAAATGGAGPSGPGAGGAGAGGGSAEPPSGQAPPNPFVAQQQQLAAFMRTLDDSDEEEDGGRAAATGANMALAHLPSLPLGSSLFMPGGALHPGASNPNGNAQSGQNGASNAPGPSNAQGGQGVGPSGAGGQGMLPPGGLPSITMLDSQQLVDMVLQDGMETSLTPGLSYGLFLPPSMAPDGLPPVTSKELKQTNSGLATMQSIEHALNALPR